MLLLIIWSGHNFLHSPQKTAIMVNSQTCRCSEKKKVYERAGDQHEPGKPAGDQVLRGGRINSYSHLHLINIWQINGFLHLVCVLCRCYGAWMFVPVWCWAICALTNDEEALSVGAVEGVWWPPPPAQCLPQTFRLAAPSIWPFGLDRLQTTDWFMLLLLLENKMLLKLL